MLEIKHTCKTITYQNSENNWLTLKGISFTYRRSKINSLVLMRDFASDNTNGSINESHQSVTQVVQEGSFLLTVIRYTNIIILLLKHFVPASV